MGRTVTILGMGLTGQAARFAPQLMRGTEIWGMNDGMGSYPQMPFSRWFEIHSAAYLEQWPNVKKFGGFVRYCHTINNMQIPTYVLDRLPIITNQVRYPQQEIAEHFQLNHVDGTPSRMLALACYEHDALGQKIDRIQSFGIDMRDPQHAPQQPAWSTWLTVAHALGIEVGGTAWDFANKRESDAGVAIDRTTTAKVMQKRAVKDSGDSDIVIATHYTEGDRYEASVERLQKQCDDLGLTLFKRNLGPLPKAGPMWVYAQVPETIRQALMKHKKPVLWIGADDDIVDAPTLPNGSEWTIGLMKSNPEPQAVKLELGPYFAINYNSGGMNALDKLEQLTKDVNDHRALCAYYAMYNRLDNGIIGIDDYIAGCIRLNPSRARTQAVTT